MKQYRLVTKAGLLASSAAAAFTFSAPAFAQEAQDATSMDGSMEAQPGGATAEETSTQEAPAGDDIVVTGTLIRNPNLESSTPVNVTTSDANRTQAGRTSRKKSSRELPGVVPAWVRPSTTARMAPTRSTFAALVQTATWCCSTAIAWYRSGCLALST
jgi:outer membrane receptor protein involved in Fe transport